jgi:hypothetical protein
MAPEAAKALARGAAEGESLFCGDDRGHDGMLVRAFAETPEQVIEREVGER